MVFLHFQCGILNTSPVCIPGSWELMAKAAALLAFSGHFQAADTRQARGRKAVKKRDSYAERETVYMSTCARIRMNSGGSTTL